MDGRDLAEHCIAFGQKLGGDYIEARFIEETARGLVYRNGAPVSGGMAPSIGIGVRILVDGNMGFASFDRLEKSVAEQAITAAYEMAKAAKRKRKIDLGEPVTNKAKWSVDLKERISDVDIDTMMKTADELNQQMSGLVQYTMMMNPFETKKYLVTSEGTEIVGFNSHISMFFILVASGNAGPEQRTVDLTQCGGWERVKEGRVVERLADEVERLQKYASNSVSVSELTGKPIDMVVGPEVAGIISHENVGHPSEGDRIKGREGAQAGESFWRDLKLGESQVGSDAVTIAEDPTIPNTAGFYLYDDEGVEARKRTLIKKGVLHEPLLNREFGSVFGMDSNGSARAVAYNREPIIRMANTFVEPGDHSLEELVEGIKLGVYMRSFMEWNIDDRRYQSKYSGAESYLIKDGEVTDTMVKRPVLETTSVGLLSAIDAVSKNLELDFAATCGKSDPMQGVPVAAGGGELRLRGIRLGGVG
ncbi:MAG: TldD/PmbA family protein [Candidatus Thorarchaeota archaeon]|nr:TldD/PmbA family protein [Candidatus Thorarchaeota archaeon]